MPDIPSVFICFELSTENGEVVTGDGVLSSEIFLQAGDYEIASRRPGSQKDRNTE